MNVPSTEELSTPAGRQEAPAIPTAAAAAVGADVPLARRTWLIDLAALAADIKLLHSVFALPFALLAAFMAASPAPGEGIAWRRFGGQLALVVLAMVFARTAAMLANRILDRTIDAANPRTARRALASGRVSMARAATAFMASAALFMAVCTLFGIAFGNWWPLWLGLPVLAWICAYGWLKRWSALCHVYLGSSLALSPVAAAIAVDPAQVAQPSIWLLAGVVLCWVAGFDVIYALQDVEVDRRQGLHSMPSRWGIPAAMWASRALHAIAAACLWTVALRDPRFGAPMAGAAAAATVLLVAEHATVARWGTTRIALSFFTFNGVISCLVGAVGIVEILRSAGR